MVENDTRLAMVEKTPPVPVAVPQGEPIVSGDPYFGASTLPMLPSESERLAEPIPDEDLDILPTGEVYASQVRYRRILNEVFGPGQWAMRPMSEPKIQDRTVMRFFALYVRGVFVSEAPGECDYQPNNPRMSYATALEAAKSNALTRCCKDLGIASECWDRRFTEKFKAEHCIRDGGKWRRKDREPAADDRQNVPTGAVGNDRCITEPQRRRLFAIANGAKHAEADVRAWLQARYQVAADAVPVSKYNEICNRLAEKTSLNEPSPPPEEENLPEWDHSEAGSKG